MKVFMEKDNRLLELKNKHCTGDELLKELRINPATVILVRNDEVVLADEEFSEKDDVKILSVISGG